MRALLPHQVVSSFFCPISEVQRNDIGDFYIINKNYPVLVNMISRQDEYFFRTLRIVVPNDL